MDQGPSYHVALSGSQTTNIKKYYKHRLERTVLLLVIIIIISIFSLTSANSSKYSAKIAKTMVTEAPGEVHSSQTRKGSSEQVSL